MAKRKNSKSKKQTDQPRRKRQWIAVVVVLSCALIAAGTLAQWRHTRLRPMMHAAVAPAQGTPDSLAANNPVKEYIYAGGRLLATEEPTPAPTPTPCQPPPSVNLIISEFRLRGPKGPTDEFIEFYNNSDVSLTVCAEDGSTGYALATSSSSIRFVIPNGTTIPAHAHYLSAYKGDQETNGYSLSSYAAVDLNYQLIPTIRFENPIRINNSSSAPVPAATVKPLPTPGGYVESPTNDYREIPDNTGLALYKTANPANFTSANLLDAVGFSGTGNSSYREGNGITPIADVDGEYSFVRKAQSSTGAPQDTGNNAADFTFISTDAGAYGRTGAVGNSVNGPSILGAPGPEGLTSPVPRFVTATLIDPGVSSVSSPNRVRCNSCTGPNAAYGTMTIRRKFTNNTGRTITRLRFRVVDITTLNSPGYSSGGSQADLRELTSSDITVTLSDGTSVPVRGTVLEGPFQPYGGGLSTSLVVNLPNGGLPQGQSVNVQFVLGVQWDGDFRFMVLMEARP